MTLRYRFLLATLACATLMGCSSSASMRDTLGLTREGPDEYRVVPRPPLSVPPEFNLRPPGEASNYISGKPAQVRARDEVLGTTSATNPAAADAKPLANTAVTPVTSGPVATGGEAQFLSNAGANKIDGQVRQKLLDEKAGGYSVKDPKYLWGGKSDSDPLVDPTKEADRIKGTKAKNKPVTEGETPVIVPKNKGILGDLF